LREIVSDRTVVHRPASSKEHKPIGFREFEGVSPGDHFPEPRAARDYRKPIGAGDQLPGGVHAGGRGPVNADRVEQSHRTTSPSPIAPPMIGPVLDDNGPAPPGRVGRQVRI
jgi:hypothetical protein